MNKIYLILEEKINNYVENCNNFKPNTKNWQEIGLKISINYKFKTNNLKDNSDKLKFKLLKDFKFKPIEKLDFFNKMYLIFKGKMKT
jgi:hypothetical protein